MGGYINLPRTIANTSFGQKDMWKCDSTKIMKPGQFSWVKYEGTWRYDGTEPYYCAGQYGTTKTKDHHMLIKNEFDYNNKFYSIFHVYHQDKVTEKETFDGFMDFFKYYKIKDQEQWNQIKETNWQPTNEYDLIQLRGETEFYDCPRPNLLMFQIAGHYCQEVWRRIDMQELNRTKWEKEVQEAYQSELEEKLEKIDENLSSKIQKRELLYAELQKRMEQYEEEIDTLVNQQEDLKGLKYETDKKVEVLENKLQAM